MSDGWKNTFHDHLDVCERCAKQPFNLCPVGKKALEESVESAYAAGSPKGGRS